MPLDFTGGMSQERKNEEGRQLLRIIMSESMLENHLSEKEEEFVKSLSERLYNNENLDISSKQLTWLRDIRDRL